PMPRYGRLRALWLRPRSCLASPSCPRWLSDLAAEAAAVRTAENGSASGRVLCWYPRRPRSAARHRGGPLRAGAAAYHAGPARGYPRDHPDREGNFLRDGEEARRGDRQVRQGVHALAFVSFWPGKARIDRRSEARKGSAEGFLAQV